MRQSLPVPAVELAKKLAPLAHGEVAAVNVAKSPLQVPDLAFQDASGKPLDSRPLARAHGAAQPVGHLVRALPQGNAGARRARSSGWAVPDFQVVAVNIDTRDPEKPKAFLKEIGVTKLAYYADPNAKTFQDLKEIGRAFGMPTTLLVDPQGCELGTIAGPAEWASDDAVKLIQAAIKLITKFQVA